MRIFLIFLSNIIACIAFNSFGSIHAIDSGACDTHRYACRIETSKSFITGILITKVQNENIVGCLVNEFGVSAIDFSFDRNKDKLKLIHVISFLNKWYIKRTLKTDLRFCLHQLFDIPLKGKQKYRIKQTGDTISILNDKRNIKYTFSPLNPMTRYDTEE